MSSATFPVREIIMHTQLNALVKLLVELLVIILFLFDFCERLQALLDQVLLDHGQNLVLMKRFAWDVERQVFGIHNTFHEIDPLRH